MCQRPQLIRYGHTVNRNSSIPIHARFTTAVHIKTRIVSIYTSLWNPFVGSRPPSQIFQQFDRSNDKTVLFEVEIRIVGSVWTLSASQSRLQLCNLHPRSMKTLCFNTETQLVGCYFDSQSSSPRLGSPENHILLLHE